MSEQREALAEALGRQFGYPSEGEWEELLNEDRDDWRADAQTLLASAALARLLADAEQRGRVPCSRCGETEVLNARPNDDIVVCERCAFDEGEQRGADRVAAALLSARVVCPVHGIPDCGPLLNCCQIPRYIAEWRGEFLADLRAALTTGAGDRVRAEEGE